MRHLKTLGVGPSDLIPPISTNMTALTDCPIRYRSLAFPSAADLFDVQSSFNHMIVNTIQLNKFVELTLNYRGQRYIKISKTPKDKGKIHKQKKARGNASLYYHPTWKPSAESTAVSVVRAMFMITAHLFFVSFVIVISSE